MKKEYVYILETPAETKALDDYANGIIGCRELGQILKCSYESARRIAKKFNKHPSQQ